MTEDPFERQRYFQVEMAEHRARPGATWCERCGHPTHWAGDCYWDGCEMGDAVPLEDDIHVVVD